MRSMRTFRRSVGALFLCGALAALQSGIAQEATDTTSSEDSDSAARADESSRDEDQRESERAREPQREDRRERNRNSRDGERPRRGEVRGAAGGEYGGGRGGYGGANGGAYGEGGGIMWPGGDERARLDSRMKLKADVLQGAAKSIVMMHGRPEMMHRIHQAAAAVNDAEDEEAKAQAQERLEQLLDDYFNEDMERREEELAQVEERVKQLRKLLERRRQKKREIVDLQVQVLLNEAEGLGFFSEPGPGGPKDVLLRLDNPFYAAPVVVPGAPSPPHLPGGYPAVQPAAPPQPPQTAPPAR